jgi:CRISPR/Cas system endoribonuclease Cas6 (RAMP superfamily)
MNVEESFVEKLKKNLKKNYRSWKKNKKDKGNNKNLQTLCLCTLGL